MSVKGLVFDEAWACRVESDYDGAKALFISKEDLIRAKLASGRPQDLVDAQRLKDTLQWEDRLTSHPKVSPGHAKAKSEDNPAQVEHPVLPGAQIQVELPSGKVVTLEIEGEIPESPLHEVELSSELVAELEKLEPGQTYKATVKEIEAPHKQAPAVDLKRHR